LARNLFGTGNNADYNLFFRSGDTTTPVIPARYLNGVVVTPNNNRYGNPKFSNAGAGDSDPLDSACKSGAPQPAIILFPPSPTPT